MVRGKETRTGSPVSKQDYKRPRELAAAPTPAAAADDACACRQCRGCQVAAAARARGAQTLFLLRVQHVQLREGTCDGLGLYGCDVHARVMRG